MKWSLAIAFLLISSNLYANVFGAINDFFNKQGVEFALENLEKSKETAEFLAGKRKKDYEHYILRFESMDENSSKKARIIALQMIDRFRLEDEKLGNVLESQIEQVKYSFQLAKSLDDKYKSISEENEKYEKQIEEYDTKIKMLEEKNINYFNGLVGSLVALLLAGFTVVSRFPLISLEREKLKLEIASLEFEALHNKSIQSTAKAAAD